mgnify:CR=1 FL=1
MQFSLGWNRAGAQTPASISSSRLQDRNFTQRGPRKSIEDDFMGKRRNCGVNEHLCFCTDANDTQQVTTRCIIAPYFIGDSERSAFRERHTFASEYVLPTSLLQEKLPNREIHFLSFRGAEQRRIFPPGVARSLDKLGMTRGARNERGRGDAGRNVTETGDARHGQHCARDKTRLAGGMEKRPDFGPGVC